MEAFYKILAAIGAGLIVWVLYRFVSARPEVLSKENLSKSFFSLGVLALILIVFVAILVLIVRQT